MLLQALKETDRLRTALLQSVSHDLRTPLTAITASASALREDVPENEREALLDGIEHEARRLVRLVENMLDLSRIEAGVLEPAPHAHAGRGAALRSRRRRRGRARRARSSTSTARPTLPPVSVDETMIRQVLVNLLENASRADPDDALGLYASSDGETLRISVVDHGHGRAGSRAAAHLRALLPAAPGPRPRRRHRPRPRDQPRLRRGPRRAHHASSRRPAAAPRSPSSSRRGHEAPLHPGRRRRADRAAGAARRTRGAGLRRHGGAERRGRARAHHERRVRPRPARPRAARG